MACTVTRPQRYRGTVAGRGELGQIWGMVSNLEALEEAVEAAWNAILEGRLEEPIRSMPVRL